MIYFMAYSIAVAARIIAYILIKASRVGALHTIMGSTDGR
jgi:hypothetical protein